MFAFRRALLIASLAMIGQSGPASAQAVASDKFVATIVIAKIPPKVQPVNHTGRKIIRPHCLRDLIMTAMFRRSLIVLMRLSVLG